jgi:hypothetical protein
MSSLGLGAQRIPLGDLGRLRGDAAVHRVLRLALGAALAAVALALVLSAVRAKPVEPTALPHASSGVIVLDASGSIAPNTYAAIGRALRTVTDARRRYGLVVFSDVAYEALPPGGSTEELEAIRRYFTPLPRTGPSTPYRTNLERGRRFPTNPWTGAFSGGTRMSSGLRLARDIVQREGIRGPAVLLLSDLGYSLGDAPAIASVLADYRATGIDLRLMPISNNRSNQAFFERLLQVGRDIGSAPQLRRIQVKKPPKDGPPLGLVAPGLFLLALLAANELWCGRLTWSPRREPA